MNVLAGHRVAPAVLDLVQESKKRFLAVTPYLKPWRHLSQIVATAASKADVVFLVRGGLDAQKSAQGFDQLGVPDADCVFLDGLHAKIYINEVRAIVASMNLYEYSTQNSWEIGIELTEVEDRDAYRSVCEQAVKLLAQGTEASEFSGERRLRLMNFIAGMLPWHDLREEFAMAKSEANMRAPGPSPSRTESPPDATRNARVRNGISAKPQETTSDAPPRKIAKGPDSTASHEISGKAPSARPKTAIATKSRAKSGAIPAGQLPFPSISLFSPAGPQYCVRCGASSALGQHYCSRHLRAWQKTGSLDRDEYYCATCGRRQAVTSRRTECASCAHPKLPGLHSTS